MVDCWWCSMIWGLWCSKIYGSWCSMIWGPEQGMKQQKPKAISVPFTLWGVKLSQAQEKVEFSKLAIAGAFAGEAIWWTFTTIKTLSGKPELKNCSRYQHLKSNIFSSLCTFEGKHVKTPFLSDRFNITRVRNWSNVKQVLNISSNILPIMLHCIWVGPKILWTQKLHASISLCPPF